MFVADCFCTFFYALGAPPTLCCFAFWRPPACVFSFMLCVLRLRSTVLPMSWGDNPGSIPYSIYLTKWVTHDPFTAVRATTSLRGERAHLTMLILSPPNGFLSRSLFHNPPHSLENGRAEQFPRFHDIDLFISVLCSIVGMCSFGCCIEGDGEGGKRGTGGENPEGEGGLQPGCPPFPGLSPQEVGRTLLRDPYG